MLRRHRYMRHHLLLRHTDRLLWLSSYGCFLHHIGIVRQVVSAWRFTVARFIRYYCLVYMAESRLIVHALLAPAVCASIDHSQSTSNCISGLYIQISSFCTAVANVETCTLTLPILNDIFVKISTWKSHHTWATESIFKYCGAVFKYMAFIKVISNLVSDK